MRPLGRLTSKILWPSMICRMVILGLACPTMARIEGRAANCLNLLRKGAVTLPCSASESPANQLQSGPNPSGSSRRPTVAALKPWSVSNRGTSSRVELERRASVISDIWASWAVRGPQYAFHMRASSSTIWSVISELSPEPASGLNPTA
jgi:hypothetical protein